jgi:hypothetical protein
MLNNKGYKKCSHCDKEKPLSEFGKDSHSKDGLKHKCRQCRSELHKAWYNGPNHEKNKEYTRKYTREYVKRKYRKLKISELQALLKIVEGGQASFNKNINLNSLTAETYVALSNAIDKIEEWLK